MKNGYPIFDLVVHVHNMLDENWQPHARKMTQDWLYHHAELLRQGVEPMPPREQNYRVPPDVRSVYDKIFTPDSQIDYAMAQVVPLFDLFIESPETYVQRVYELVNLDRKRMIFCGGTDPVICGLDKALRDISFQITELGARSIKLYTAHAFGKSWRMDDREIAYPMYERMLSHGINLVQVHKGDPIGAERLEDGHPGDVHQAALDFPQMNFIVHHLAFPFDDAAIDLGARLPNVYLAMSTWINMIQSAPVETAMRLGKMLRWCGPEKVVWGSETPIWSSTQKLLDLCWKFQIPDDLQRGWGFPNITDEDRGLMFGGNIMRLLGMSARVRGEKQ